MSDPCKKDVAAVGSLALFAFVVTATHAETSVIAFAPNRSTAKKLARRSEWLEDFDWIELRVKRERRLDEMANQRGTGIIDGSGDDDARIMRNLGWWQFEGGNEECAGCKLYPWEGLPESGLEYVGDDLLCGECRNKANERLSNGGGAH